MADSLVWITDVCIFLSQHGEAFQHFRATLEAGKTAQTAERIALRYSRRTMPVGGAAAAPLQQARARR